MNRDEHVKQMRQAADANRAEAADQRKEFDKHQAKADEALARVARLDELANGWDQIADSIQSGELIPYDMTELPVDDGVLADWERELLARTDAEDLTADEREDRAAAWSEEAAAEEAELAEEQASPLSSTPLAVAFGASIDAPRPFAIGDLVNVADPRSKHEVGLRGKVVGFEGDDPDSQLVVIEHDFYGSTKSFEASQLMHHQDFLRLDDPDGLLADVHSVHDVAAINRAAAEQAGGTQ